MNIILILSVLLNFALGFLYWKESSKPGLERSIVETHEEPRIVEKKIYVKVPSRPLDTNRKKLTENEPQSAGVPSGQMTEFDPKVYEQSVEKVTQDREVFMQESLDLTPEDLQKIEKVKKDFYKEADQLILGMSEPTIEQRRQLLDLEESREAEFARIMGREKWEKFKKYRDDYNRKSFDRQADEQSVFIPMDI